MKSLAIALLTLAAANPAFAGPNTQKVSVTNGPDRQMVSLSRVASHAIEQSKLTIQGSVPFHLKASIVETTNPDSTYKAEIDEYWLSPEKWRRTIQSLGFSQTLIVNGDKLSEKDTGDYYPWWLNELVIAIFDPLPMLDQLKQINAQIAEPRGSGGSSVCARLQSKPGILVFCFKSAQGLLDYVVSPGPFRHRCHRMRAYSKGTATPEHSGIARAV